MPLPCPSAGLQRRVGRAAERRLPRRLGTKETLIQMNATGEWSETDPEAERP
jgi:hypothetical protein